LEGEPRPRHAKRWQDVEELLEAGITVHTTVNVQHVESLNDIVAGITGVRMQETIPDNVFERADDVVMIDTPPDVLLERLQAGKVYIPEQARNAIENFFRKGNLIALRELALRTTADRVDAAMREYREGQGIRAGCCGGACSGPRPTASWSPAPRASTSWSWAAPTRRVSCAIPSSHAAAPTWTCEAKSFVGRATRWASPRSGCARQSAR